MNELSKNLKCIMLKSGIEIWKESDRVEKIFSLIQENRSGFISIDDEMISVSEISGIFSPSTMSDHIHRKNGEWKCKYNTWHDRGKKCECKTSHMSGEELAKFAQH